MFQSYKYTTISNATLSYYLAPIFVIVLSPLVLKEKLTIKKSVCIMVAMVGLFLIINTAANEIGGVYNHFLGICYGILAAVLYASVILMNKFMKNLSGYETTLVQLTLGSMVLLPYVLVKNGVSSLWIAKESMIWIIILGVVHTGVAYFMM